jgi:hypothetical protein
MNFKSFYPKINEPRPFEDFALAVFQLQVNSNPVYRKYIHYLGIDPQQVDTLEKIPFMPIGFFKYHDIKTGDWQTVKKFKSSGTSGLNRSIHSIADLDYYHENAKSIFEYWYGPLDQYHILALLPSYLEQGDSSLIEMAAFFISRSGSPYSDFFNQEYEKLADTILQCQHTNRKVLLLGVSYALLDWPESLMVRSNTSQMLVMETGGMKGRRKEMVRSELHGRLKAIFNVSEIHSEYGMTEMLSQFYAREDGKFQIPWWCRTHIRDLNDPFSEVEKHKTGGLNVFDLANIHSCCFLETEDLARIDEQGYLRILGRKDHSDVRGCNLLYTEPV